MSELDFKVKLITDVLDVEFTGTTNIEKQTFIDKHFEARQKVVAQMLGETFREMVSEGSNGK